MRNSKKRHSSKVVGALQQALIQPSTSLSGEEAFFKTASIGIVEDDQSLLNLLSDFLLEKGFEVYGYTCPLECQKAFQSDRIPSILLCDLGLPHLSGIELTQWIHQHYPGFPLAIMTASGNGKGATALAAGAKFFLEKPFSLNEIEEIVSSLLPLAP